MFRTKYSMLLVAAAILGGTVVPQAVHADEVYTQVTRTTTTDAAVPVDQSVTTTERRTIVTGSTPGVVEKRTVFTSSPGVVEKKTVVTSETTPGSVIVTDAPASTVVVTGSAIPLGISQAPVILQTVDLRRAKLDKAIVDARTAGSLSEAQAASLRRELDRIGTEVVYLKAQPNPSLIRSVVLAQDLDALTVNMRGTVSTVTFVPIIEGSHFTVYNGSIVQLDDLAVRRIELENKILAAQAAGRISFDQANHMRSELNAIAAMEDAYNASNNMTFKNSREIYRDMDRVASELDRSMH